MNCWVVFEILLREIFELIWFQRILVVFSWWHHASINEGIQIAIFYSWGPLRNSVWKILDGRFKKFWRRSSHTVKKSECTQLDIIFIVEIVIILFAMVQYYADVKQNLNPNFSANDRQFEVYDVIWEIKYYWLHTYAVSRKIIRTSTLQEIWHDEIGISFWEIEKLIEFHFTVVVIGSIYEHSIPNSNQLDLPEVLDRFYLSSVFKKKQSPMTIWKKKKVCIVLKHHWIDFLKKGARAFNCG